MKYLRLAPMLSEVGHYETVHFDRMHFSAGEFHIKLTRPKMHLESVVIESNGDVMSLLLATDALRRAGAGHIDVLMPYVPYGRQDRVMVPGEPLSARVYCDIINSQGYRNVYTLDNHSSVVTALLNNVVEIDNTRIMERVLGSAKDGALICPDAGAMKRTYALSKKFGVRVVECSKRRDVATGDITETIVHADSLDGLDCYIVDDICDGGRTFVEIAKVLRSKKCGSVTLYVSHGIFSKNLSVFEGLIDHVITTNLFRDQIRQRVRMTVLPLEKGDLK